MKKVIVYCTATCPYCTSALQLLSSKKIAYEQIRVDINIDSYQEMMDRSGRSSVPQIFIDQHHVGGYDDLSALDRNGELDLLLENT